MPTKATYTIEEARPLPAQLGTVFATLDRQILTWVYPPQGAGNCESRSVDASYADLRIVLSDDALPYADLFSYRVLVDGNPVARYRSGPVLQDYPPRGQERVLTVCGEESSAIRPGVHSVRFEGALPDGTTLSTPELSLELRCDAPSVPPSGIAPFTPDGGNRWDWPSQPDASVPRDDVAAEVETGGAGDGCALGANHSGLPGLLLALAMLRQRRRAGSDKTRAAVSTLTAGPRAPW